MEGQKVGRKARRREKRDPRRIRGGVREERINEGRREDGKVGGN